jgi:hypothetical protein
LVSVLDSVHKNDTGGFFFRPEDLQLHFIVLLRLLVRNLSVLSISFLYFMPYLPWNFFISDFRGLLSSEFIHQHISTTLRSHPRADKLLSRYMSLLPEHINDIQERNRSDGTIIEIVPVSIDLAVLDVGIVVASIGSSIVDHHCVELIYEHTVRLKFISFGEDVFHIFFFPNFFAFLGFWVNFLFFSTLNWCIMLNFSSFRHFNSLL